MNAREKAEHLKRLEALDSLIQAVYSLENHAYLVAELQSLGTDRQRQIIQGQVRNLHRVLKQLGDN